MNQYYHLALERFGIPLVEQKDRGLTFHSWRHWFNSALRANAVTDGKIRMVLGHRTPAMTERYTSFKLEDYQDISTVQKRLFDG